MLLSRFNPAGIKAFQEQLQKMRAGEIIESPLKIISNSNYIEQINNAQEISVLSFSTRFDIAAYLNPVLLKTSIKDDMVDTGLWSWLSAVYIDTVCPQDETGRRDPKNDYRHIPSSDWRNFYRHLIRGPVRIIRLFEDNPETAAIVLCQHPASPGDFVEQLAARQERITNPAIIATANRLYFDRENKRPKKGAAPNWHKPGTLRRFTSLLDQLDLTYDLYSMTEDNLINILPAEFNVFVENI